VTWKRGVHHTRLFVQALFAVLVITAAVIVGLGQLALPWIVSHPEKISAFLSDKLHRAVTLDQVEGQWEHDGPVLTLHGVHIAPAAPEQAPLTIPQAQLKINFLGPFRRNQAWNEFRLVGLDLHLVRNAAGDWRLQGLDTAASEEDDESSPLFDLGSLVLRDVKFTIDDSTAGRHIALGSDEIRLINSGDYHRVLARVKSIQTPGAAPIDAVAEYDSGKKDGRLYLGGAALDVAAMVRGTPLAGWQMERGEGRVQVWANWTRDQLAEVRAEVDMRNVVMTTPQPISVSNKQAIVPRTAFDRIAFGARWRRAEHGWNADIGDFAVMRQAVASPAASIHVEKVEGDDPNLPTYNVSADNLELAAPASVAMLSDALPEVWRQWLYEADPVGEVRDFELRYVDGKDFDVSGEMAGIAWHSVGAIPGVSSITASLLGDQDSLALYLPQKTAFGFDVPKVFRQPFRFSNFAGDIAIYRGDESWRIETDAVDFEGASFGGQMRGVIELHDDGSKPSLDVAAVVTHAQAQASHLFWPINSMPPTTVRFLDRAIESGTVTNGRAVFRGDLADWPFRSYTGRFQARAELEDVRLPYLPDWPVADHLRATADFVNTSLRVEATAAQSMGVKVERAIANFADFGDAVLELDVSANGAGKDLLSYLKATPVGQHFGAQLLGVDMTGNSDVDFHLQVPLKHAEELQLAGRAQLTGADLSDAKYNIHFNDAKGEVRFNQKGFLADNLGVTMNDKPGKFRLAVGGFAADPRHGAEGFLQADLPARDLLAYAPMLEGYSDRVTGSAAWNIAFAADNDTVKSPSTRITVKSDLRGIALDLPAPLAKSAEMPLPLTLVLDPPTAGGKVDLTLGNELYMHGRLVSATAPFAANIGIGTDTDAPLPPAGLKIGGVASQLDVTGWMDFATSDASPNNSGSSSDVLAGIDVRADALLLYSHDFGPAAFTLTPAKDALDLKFTGDTIGGSLHIPTVELKRRGITAEFAKLYWPDSKDDDDDNQVSTANPASVPPLHIRIDDFHLGQSVFGKTTVESYPVADGTHFEQVGTPSNNVEMRAHGDWLGRPGSDRSTFSIDLSAHNLGRMLGSFGYAGVVDDGQTVAHMEGSWPGPPSNFALAKLDGTLNVSVKSGRIPEANPGAGRIFGLFNFASLPRRLTLDFGDFFKSGFAFDSITGNFTLKNGNAYTSDLVVKGPAAEIAVNGRTGLKTKDYDQTMQVTPHVGGTLVVGGALIAGPVGAGVGAVLQGMFKNVTRNRYSVTGSWDKPVMTLIGREKIENPRKEAKDGAPQSPGGLHRGGL
jgi:uncharacterized protein (TIGR02099 family)